MDKTTLITNLSNILADLRSRGAHLLPAAMIVSFFVATSLFADTIRVPQDHKTIQAAIDSAKAGDTVVVGARTYRERIRLKPGLTVKSAGDDAKGKLGLKRAETTIIDGNVEGAAGPGVEMAEDSTLDGFSVTGIGKYDDARWNRHHATQGEEQAKELIGAGTAGIAVAGINRCTVANNIVHHIGYTGIGITGEKGKRVSPYIFRNVTYRNMGGGIGSMRGSSATIEENICFENFYAGIGHEDAAPLVTNNSCFKNVRAGIGISEGACPTVRGNKCFHNRRAGIGIRTASATSPVVEHNECFENDMAGIGSRDHATPIIRNNRCYKNKMAGIGSRTGARPIIEGNHCYENLLAGIGSQENAVPIIFNNHCEKNGQAGIGTETGARAVIVGNQCRHNSTSGIAVREKSNMIALDNKCVDNKLVAIGVRNGSDAYIGRNQLKRTGGMPPMIAVREDSSAIVADNTIIGGGVAGIMVQGTAAISGNQFQGNGPRAGGPPNFAAWIQGGSNVSFFHNQTDRWRHAFYAAGANQILATDNTARNFLGTAIVVDKSKRPAHVFGNVAVSDNQNDKAAAVNGPQGVVADNLRKAPEPPAR